MKSTVGSIIVATLLVAALITWQGGGWFIWIPVLAGLAIGWSVGKALVR